MDECSLLGLVREVLLKEWDPLGVGDNPMLSDEYDLYVHDLVRILHGPSPTTVALARYLANVESDKMGLRSDPLRVSAAADALLKLA